ncbi:MAG: serine/threonine-protein kinase [Myxococcales bacterium]
MGTSGSHDTDLSVDTDSAFDALLREAAQVSEPPCARPHAIWAVGTTLAAARFTITRRIGAGGMGIVYEAYDAERRAPVALKTLVVLDAAGVYRLKSEFRALSHVHHPNLVRLHELFCDRGRWFFTMDFIEGKRFDHWVRPDGLDEVRLRDAFGQLTGAIGAIHAGGKLHRDLKPSNVLVTSAGKVVVLDFGLVATTSYATDGSAPVDERFGGTPAYMAPEQAAGGAVTGASDFYALGVMLFEALTGGRPFEGRPAEVLLAKQRVAAPQVSEAAADAGGAPGDLCALCDRLLDRDPARRPDEASLLRACGPVGALDGLDRGHASLVPPNSVRPVFLGRHAELSALRAAFQEARAGRPTVLFVSGESGMGKSALVEAFLAELRAHAGAVVLAGRCNERENVPYKALDALVDELSRHLRQLSPADAARFVPPEAFTLPRLFPVLERVPALAEAPQRAVLDLHDLQARAFGAFSELMRRLCEHGPLVLFIDDLQWTDDDSVRLLRHLLMPADPLPALLVFAHRSEQAEHDARLKAVMTAATQNRSIDMRRLVIGGLDADALVAFVRGELAAHAQTDRVQAIARESGGSPFLVAELARASNFVDSERPVPTLTEALSLHVGRLPEMARRLLSLLALAGQPLAPSLVVEAAGAAHGHELLDLLRSERLVRVGNAGRIGEDSARAVECYHDRIRELVASELSPELTRELFAGLARALSERQHVDPELSARCLEGAGQTQEAAAQALLAAERAMQALAFERAAALYQKALSLGHFEPEATRKLQRARGDALARAGHGLLASEVYLAAREGASPEQAAELSQQAGVLLLMLGRSVRGREVLAEGLRPLGIHIPEHAGTVFLALLWARFRLRLHGLRFDSRPRSDAATLARLSALRSAATSFGPSDTLRFALFNARWLLLGLRSGNAVDVARAVGGELVLASYAPGTRRRIPELSALGDELVEAVSDVDAHFSMRWGHAWACLHDPPWRADWSRSLAHTEACIALAREHPVSIGAYVEPWCQYMRGALLASLGRFQEVRTIVRAQFGHELLNRNLTVLPALATLAALVLPALGEHDEAERIVRESRASWSSDEVAVQDLNLLLGLSFLARHRGEAVAGWLEFCALWERMRSSLLPRVIMAPMLSGMGGTLAAAAAREVDQPSERAALERQARRLLGRAANSGSRAARLSVRTQLACLSGDRRRAAQHLRGLLELEGLSPLVEHASKRQLGRVLGDSQGRALITAADRWFEERGVLDPERLSGLVMPGADFL